MEKEFKNSDEDFAVIQFEHYYVKEMEANFDEPDANTDQKFALEPFFKHEYSFDEEDSKVKVSLACEIKPDNQGTNFYIGLELVGFFSTNFPSDFTDKDKENIFTSNASAILFPYLRSTISSITQAANVATLTLPTINVARMFEEN